MQRVPDLFMPMRVLGDRRPLPARLLVLGSASSDLLRQSSESLAGRIAYHELGGLALGEVGAARPQALGLRKANVGPDADASMRTALTDLHLDRLDILHAGDATFPLADKVRAVAAARTLEDLHPLSRS